MGKWSPWSNCSCGYENRTRKCLMDDCLHFEKDEKKSCTQPMCAGNVKIFCV